MGVRYNNSFFVSRLFSMYFSKLMGLRKLFVMLTTSGSLQPFSVTRDLQRKNSLAKTGFGGRQSSCWHA